MRYLEKNISVEVNRGEDYNTRGWDEAWIYNCLQLTEDLLESCFMDITKIKSGTVTLAESGCYGEAYYGVFET